MRIHPSPCCTAKREVPTSQFHASALNCTTVHHSLCWQAPSAGEYLVLLGEELEHAVEVPSQQVLAADLDHAWKVVDFLEQAQTKPRISTGRAGTLLEAEESRCVEKPTAAQGAGPAGALTRC